MQQETLPIPNPGDWLTVSATAQALGTSRRTVMRMAARGALRDYSPIGADGEKPTVLFWWADVAKIRAAREAIAAGQGKP